MRWNLLLALRKWLSSTSAPAPVSDSESQEVMYLTCQEANMAVEEKQSKAAADKSNQYGHSLRP